MLFIGFCLHSVAQQPSNGFDKPKKGAIQPLPALLRNADEIDGRRTNSKNKAAVNLLTAKTVRDSTGTLVYVEYRRSLRQNVRGRVAMTAAALDYVQQLKPLLKLDQPADELKVQTVEEDELKQTHIRLQQQYKGLEVYGGELILHAQNNQFTTLNGRHFKTPTLTSVAPRINEKEAEQLTLADLKTHTTLRDLTAAELRLLKKQVEAPELLIYYPENQPETAHLAWRLMVRPNFIEHWAYFIDAQTGEVLAKANHACSIDGPSKTTSRDLNNVNQTVNTYQKGSGFFLIDGTKSMFNSRTSVIPDNTVGAIVTLDARNSTDEEPSLFYVSSNNNTWTSTAVSAHINAGLAFDYYSRVHKRNSIDEIGRAHV